VLRAEVEAVDRTGEVLGADEVAEELAAPETDPAENARFAFAPSGEMVAWGWVNYWPNATRHYRVMLEGAVHPRWRERGIGTELLSWLAARGREVAPTLPVAQPTWLEVKAEARDDARAQLFAAAGYAPLRHMLELRRDLSTPLPRHAIPAGLHLVPYDPALDEPLRIAHNEAFRDQWGSDERDRAAWDRWYTGSRHFRPDLSFLVLDPEDSDAIAGYALSAIYAEDAAAAGFTAAWTTNLGTRRPWRGRGVASALLSRALHAYADAGLEYASLDVDAENPSGALGLYQRAEYETVRDVVSFAKHLRH
jgi:ribosomal protein S18 acetylase RimI-like enzyme